MMDACTKRLPTERPWALAALVAAVAVACNEGPSLDDSWGNDVGGERIELFEPIGRVETLPDYFSWDTATAASYAVAVMDSNGNLLWKATDLPAPSREVTPDLHRIIEPGIEYGWQVLAVEGDGTVRGSSSIGRFSVVPAAAPEE